MVEDIEQVFAVAKENGGEVMAEGLEHTGVEIRGSLYDPDGNTLEFIQIF